MIRQPICRNCGQPIVISNIDSYGERKEWTHDRIGRRYVTEDRRTCLMPRLKWLQAGVLLENIPVAQLWEDNQTEPTLAAIAEIFAEALPEASWRQLPEGKTEDNGHWEFNVLKASQGEEPWSFVPKKGD